MFTITGTVGGSPATVVWEDGVAEGRDEGGQDAVHEVKAMESAGVYVGLGPWSGTATLGDERLARIALLEVLDDGAVIDGDDLEPGETEGSGVDDDDLGLSTDDEDDA